jgi:hypothetical protein
MSHTTNRWEFFTTYTPLQKSVHGVGNAQASVEGRGDIKIKSVINRNEHELTLRDVLYIPSNQQNLLSLSWWDKARGIYHSGQG